MSKNVIYLHRKTLVETQVANSLEAEVPESKQETCETRTSLNACCSSAELVPLRPPRAFMLD